MAEEWTDAELRATIKSYLKMLAAQQSGTPYSKTAIRRALRQGALKARTEPSIEYRMRNISAVLAAHGRPTVNGYIAANNVGEAVSNKIWRMVRKLETSPAKKVDKRPPIIYFNIGWMKDYAGPRPDDRTIGAHRYLVEHSHGAECFNFLLAEAGMVRGYRPPGNQEKTNISRVGGGLGRNAVHGVLVVWLAKEPQSGKTMIIGWYRNATVFREAVDGGLELYGERIHYSAEAHAEDAVLLPPVARTFEVRSSRGNKGAGFGQKPTWYGADRVDAKVWAYISVMKTKSGEGKSSTSPKPPKNFDPELRRKVEKEAVKHAIAYYKAVYGPDCSIISVEAAARGWDLEVYVGPAPLLVEVKGLLGSNLVCELTPNEYEKMMLRKNRSRYVVYVVNNALAEAPHVPLASIFMHAGGRAWQTADGREMLFQEKMGAVLSCRVKPSTND